MTPSLLLDAEQASYISYLLAEEIPEGGHLVLHSGSGRVYFKEGLSTAIAIMIMKTLGS